MRKSRHRPAQKAPASPKKTTPIAPVSLAQLSREALRGKMRRVEAELLSLQSEEPKSSARIASLQEQRQALLDELAARHHTNRRIILILLGIFVIMALSLTGFFLYNKAYQAHLNLQRILHIDDAALIKMEMQRAQAGLNSLLVPELRPSIVQAQLRLEELQQRQDQSQQWLNELEQNPERWESLTPQEIRQLNSTSLNHSPMGQELAARWKQLIDTRRAQQRSLRGESLEKILRPLPAAFVAVGSPERDLALLNEEREALEERLAEWQTLRQIHRLNPRHMDPLRERLKCLRLIHHDILALTELEHKLNESEHYSDYTLALHGYKAHHYPLGKQLQKLQSELPRQDDIERTMSQHQSRRSSDLSPDQPSFHARHPANVAQVALMEHIFQSRPLHSQLYQLRNPELHQSWTCDKPPKLHKQRVIKLTLSALDPHVALGAKRRLLIQPNPQLVLRRFRPKEYLKSLGLQRESFFQKVSIPHTLERILADKSPYTNARLKLYLYSILARVMEAEQHSGTSAMTLAPQLREDILSLRKLERKTGVILSDISWLRYDALHQRAEQQYAAWISQRVGRQYLAEMRLLLREHLHFVPEYIGYIGSDGSPYLQKPLSEEEPLWYLDKESHELTLGTQKNLRAAALFSPLLRPRRL